MFGARPRKLTAVVAVLTLVVTGVLTVLAWQANAHSERRLLDRQLAQVGTLLSNQAAVLQIELSDIGQVAVNTSANPAAFARFAAGELKQTGQSLSLWRIGGGPPERLALQGVEARLPAAGTAAFSAVKPTGQLVVLGILPGSPDRLAYGLMPAAGNNDLLIYAETPLPPGRRMPVTGNSPLSGLDLALYLGRDVTPERLLEATAPTPIRGEVSRTTVPFGTAQVTVVGASPTSLTGALASALPWIVLGVGCVLAVTAAATVEYVSRRRLLAEGLAAENERLYRQQRGIAGTLQHALLPDVPHVDGVEIGARYLAGVDELDVGGDWYDVIALPSGRVVFVVGDVSGRGLPAATTMASLRFAVRAYVAQGDDIVSVLAKLRGLLDVGTDQQFATVLLGELHPGTGVLRIVSAGHFPPLLLTGGRVCTVDCPVTPPVGVPAPAVGATEVRVPGTATMLSFSDGLVERRGEVIDVGLERLATVAGAAAGRPLEQLLDEVLRGLTGDGGRDDTVLLGMRWPS
jgi:hypothetical protein